MLGRYAELKAQLPAGTILFYQVGTFFETFEEDAKTISRELSRPSRTPGDAPS
jgi:DNA mismatch repair protein MutS